MHQERTPSKRNLREHNFRFKILNLATQIYVATNIKVSDITYVQYLHTTDAARLTRVPKKTPKIKSRIKCTLILDCSFKKLCRCKFELAKINNILACQWDLVEISPDKCGIIISYNPHNIG